MTLVGDGLKGFIPVSMATAWQFSEVWIGLAAMAAFLGHLYPLFLHFKGGKGVATALGIFLALSPLAVMIGLLLFATVLATSRIVSLGSLSGAFFMPILVWMFTGSLPYLIMSITVGGLIFYRHRANIQRLISGQENRISLHLRRDS